MKRKVLLSLFSFVLSINLFAQQFPVNIIPRVKAPAPINFYNYADDTALQGPITVQVFLNDLTVSNRQIRLKTYFEGGNINFTSKDFVIGAQDLFIEGGIPLTLTNAELAPYYRFENIQGIGQNVYAQAIPEGTYNFCFEVYDFISGAKLSDKKCATVFIFKNEPPILNLPFNGKNIEPSDFENIVFQWTPRHINVSNVEYDFSIVEIWDHNVDPQTAFLSQAPIYEETVRTTSLFYGPDKPLLLAGRKYAWRVRARALQGLEEIGLFKNEGYSEIFWFSRTAPCQIPDGVSGEPKGTSKINVFWDQDPTLHSEYIIAYREANNPDANWFTKKTNSAWATIWDLKAGTAYEFKVKGKCTYQYSEYSELQYVTTDIVQNEDANYNCGIVPDEVAISNREPHPGLNIGDQITAGDFKVTVTEIQSQSNGILSGKGFVEIPYLKFAKFGVTFTNILVNTDAQLAEGEIVTLYDPEFGEGASMTVDVNINISEGINGDSNELDDTVEVDFVIDTVEIDANGAIVVTGTNGETATIPGDDDVNIVSSNGDVWSVGEDGTITKQEGAQGGAVSDATTNGLDSNGNVTSITAKGITIEFEPSGYYHFDELPENTSATFEKEYKILDTESGKYRVPYKAISDNNGEDFINAKVTITDTSIIKDSIVFKTKDGAKIPVEWNGDIAKLQLKRKFDYVDEEIFAVVKSKNNGKYDVAGSVVTAHLASEQLDPINVTLVPVGIDGVSDEVKNGVKEIYAKAGVRLNIQDVKSISPEEIYGWDKDGDNRLSVGDSNLLSHYTDEEAVFNSYIKQQSYYNNKTYYVFVTNVSVNKTDVNGFMPLKRQFGYVFTANANSATKQIRTMAHELGHGIFGLKHTWDEYKFPQGATDHLMDYGNGTTLNHLDWKKIHAPGIKIYWFQGDEDGEHITEKNEFPDMFLNSDKKSFSFITPSGDFVDLPKSVRNVTFTFGIYDLQRSKDIVTGCLYGFEIDEKKFVAHYDENSFYGYKSGNEYYDFSKYLNDNGYKGFEDKIVMGLPNSSNYVITKFEAKALDIYNTNSKILSESNFKIIPFSNANKAVGKNKTYSYPKALIGDKADDLNLEVYSKLLSKHNKKPTLLSVLKIIQLANSYEKMYKTFDECIDEETNKSWYHNANKFFDFVFDTTGTLDCYINIIPNAKELINSNNKLEFYTLYLEAFKNYLKGNVDACGSLLSSINKDSSVGAIELCLSLLSNKDIEKIPTDKRLLAISIMLDEWWVDNSQETQLVRLIGNVTKENSDAFLKGLLGKSLIEGEDYSLIRRLTYKVDNDHTWLTEDNYLGLMKALTVIALKSNDFKTAALAYSDEDFLKHNINFYHRSFWDGVKETGATSFNIMYVKCSPDTTVDWYSDDSVDISIQNVLSCNLIEYPTTEPLRVSPLKPIWFINKSSLSMLSDYNKKGPVLAPAILAYYANDVGNTKNIIDGIEAAIDVATLATGYGAIAKAPSALRKAFIIADMIGAGVNITLNSSSENLSPGAKTVLQTLNVLTAVVAVGELGSGGIKSLKALYKKAKNNTKSLPSKKQVDDFLNNLLDDKVTPDEIAEIGANKIKEAEIWLKTIEAEKQASNSIDLALKAKNARAKLLLVKKLLKIDSKDIKSAIKLTDDEAGIVKNYINKSDEYIDVIVHADDTGKGFPMVVEVDGIAKTVTLSATEFAQTLRNVPKDKKIRLLSCNNPESAKEISKVLGRDIVGSTGDMKLYDNGYIYGEGWFIAKADGKTASYTPNNNGLEATNDFIQLGKKLDDPLLEAIRVGKRKGGAKGTLAIALRNAGFPKCADAVAGASSVNKNNKRLLHSDTQIPEAVKDYSRTRNNITFKKGQPPAKPTETWGEFFERINKVVEEGGNKLRHFNQFESHHIFPIDLFKNESFRKWYELVGHKHFDINGKESLENLIMLEAIRRNPVNKEGVPNFVGGVHAVHNKYTEKIGKYFDKLWQDAKGNSSWDDAKIAREIDDDILNLSERLKQSLLENSVRGNVELPTYWETIKFEDLIK